MRKLILVAAAAAVLAWSGAAFGGEEAGKRGRRDEGRWHGEKQGGERGEHGERGERMEKLLGRIKDKNPEQYENLMRLKEENPELFREKLQEMVREFKKQGKRRRRMDPETRERMQEIRKLENESRELSKQYRNAESEDEKKNIAGDLKAILVKIFDLKLLSKQKEVERVESDLKELKDLLKKREESRDEVIQNRFDELTGKTTHLRW